MQHAHPESLRQREVMDLVRGVVSTTREQRIARLKIEGRHRLYEPGGRVRHDRHVRRPGAYKPPKKLVCPLNLTRALGRRLVASDVALQLEMIDDRLVNRCRHQARACVVEMSPEPAARGSRSPSFHEVFGNHSAT